jgi:DNA processing protein
VSVRNPGWPEGFAEGAKNRAAVLALASVSTLNARRLLELAAETGTASACVAAVKERGLGGDATRTRLRELDPGTVAGAVAACGARVVPVGCNEYPGSLHDLADPPLSLFVRGRDLQEIEPCVSIVGARRCSAVGKEVAQGLGRGLAAAGVTVVSGGAMGIDTASHEGALAAGGLTLAVLGCGIDIAYPPRNRNLLDRIESNGAVVSEYPPGVPPEGFHFPARNRIVAALAEAVVIVEGRAGSGSLITADHALDLGRQVFAVPGAVNNPLAEVPLSLIRDGASMIRDADDLLADMGRLDPGGAAAVPRGVSEGEEAVLALLTGPTLPEHVARSLGWDLGDALRVLLGLEMRGVIRSAGGRFEHRVGSAK